MSEQTKDIKDLDLLQDVSDDDRVLMTKASEGHAAKTLKFADLKNKVLGSMEKPITSITKQMVEDVLKGNITSHSHTFAGITGKPTTLSGYGITDAVTLSTTQTISGAKVFTNSVILNNASVSIAQKLNTLSNYGAAISWLHGDGTVRGRIGMHNTGDSTGAIILTPYTTSVDPWGSTQGLYISKTRLKWENKSIWHSGNSNLDSVDWRGNNLIANRTITAKVATGTAPIVVNSTTMVNNLNADLLDGLHASSFSRGGYASFIANGVAAGRWVRIAQFTSYNSYGIVSIQNTYNNNAPTSVTFVFNTGYRADSLPSITQIGGYANLFTQVRVVYPTVSNPSATSPGYIEVYYATTRTGNTLSLRLSNAFNCSLITAYQPGNIPSGFTSKAWTFVSDGISAPNIKATTFMGTLSGNSSSATRLQTPRTLWGKSFDGTGNISGILYSNGTSNTHNNTWIQNGGMELFNTTPYIDFHFNNSSTDYTSRIIELSSGRLTVWNALSVNTTNSAYTLHVGGTIGASSNIVSSGVISSNSLSVNNRLTIDSTGRIIPSSTSARRAGMYGVYDSAKIGHVWSIGTSYMIPDDGANFGNLYGLAYKYITNTTGGNMAGGHQICFVSNGTAGTSIGLAGGIWTKGNIAATGEITAYSSSDIRLKENIQKLEALSFLRKINTYSFDWKEGALSMKVNKHKHDQGFIAQEINEIAPHFVTNNLWGKGFLGIDKTKFIPYLVAGINELDDEFTLLKRRVDMLEKENKELRTLIKTA